MSGIGTKGATRSQRSTQATTYRAWYNTRTWKALRAAQLQDHPLCQCPHCQAGKRKVRIATTVDHIKPHRGDWDLFSDPDNLQSMAAECHNRFKQSAERGGAGFDRGSDVKGLPLVKQEHW